MKSSIVWITGARGFIGQHLVRELSSQGCIVAGIGHGNWSDKDAAQWGLQYWCDGEVSLNNCARINAELGAPDVIYHLAGGASVGAAIERPYEDFNRTVSSTAQLLEWVRQFSPMTRIVSVSSAAVYGAAYSEPILENVRLSPFSPYGAHKLMMEDLCRSYACNFGLRVVLPRLFSVYGAGLKKQLLWDLCCKLSISKSVELGGNGDELRDWIDVSDVVIALTRLKKLATEDAPAINIASGNAVSVKEIAGTVADCWHELPEAIPRVVFNGVSRPGDPFSLVADVSLMRMRGIEINVPLVRGIKKYVEWFKDYKQGIA